MEKLKLNNRDHAKIWLERIGNSNEWNLKIDNAHKYCLEYMRIGGRGKLTNKGFEEISMIDPSGGPYLEIGDKIENYEIVKFITPTKLVLSERT